MTLDAAQLLWNGCKVAIASQVYMQLYSCTSANSIATCTCGSCPQQLALHGGLIYTITILWTCIICVCMYIFIYIHMFIGAPDAQCLQVMPHSPVKFIGAPDAQCLQVMPHSPVKFIGAPDAQCLQGMLYSLVKFTGGPDAQCLQGICTLLVPLECATFTLYLYTCM